MTAFLARRAVWVLGAAVVLALAAIPIALRLDMSTELVHLLPAHLPSVQSFREFERTIGGHTFVTVLIESPDRNANVKFGEAVAARLGKRTWAYQVHFRREVEFVERRWPFLLSGSELEKLESDLRDALSRAKVRHSPLAIDLDDKPLHNCVPTEPRPSGSGCDPDWDELRRFVSQGGHGQGSFREYRINEDGTRLLVQVQLKQLSTRLKATRAVLADAQRDIDALGPAAYHPQLRARLYGGLRYRVEEYDSILRDLAKASLITFPLMLLIPALALRSRWEPIVILVPVAVGMAWTYAGAQLVFGSLNLVTSFLFLILFGVGDDYPIHLLYRIREEMTLGGGVRAATERALRRTAAPLAFAAVTDTAGFFALAWMQFRGFSQFGVIAGSGVCLILLATFVTVPGIVWLIRRLPGGAVRASQPTVQSPIRWTRVVAALAVWLVVTAAAGWLVQTRLRFEDDFDRLHPRLADLGELRAKVDTMEGYQRSTPAVFFTRDFEASRAISRELQERCDRDGGGSPIGRVLSVASIVDGDSLAKRALLTRIFALLDDPSFRRAPADVREQIERLRNRIDLSPLAMDGIPVSIRRSLTREIEDGGRRSTFYLVVVEPRRRVALAPEALAFAGRLEGVQIRGESQVPAGEALILAEILKLVKKEAWVVVALACVACGTVVLLAFRSLADLAALMLTLAGAICATLAVLGVFGVRLNFYNVTVLPLLVGLGINYGIHILHRYHEERVPATHGARRLRASVGSAAATTMVGFAGLLVAGHPGLRSMGFTASLGIAITAASCLVFLPAFVDLLNLLARRRDNSVTKALHGADRGRADA